MLNLKITSRPSSIFIGLLIFFVPFFTYLSPENLRQLSRLDIFEILLSLLIILIVIFTSAFSIEIIVKRLFNRKILLFYLFCFAFYLNFFFTPFSETIQKILYQDFGHTFESGIFVLFELCCIAIIAVGARFHAFSIRVILIFSILMLVKAFIPIISYLAENIGTDTNISYEVESGSYSHNNEVIDRNVYFIILDEMAATETAIKHNIITQKDIQNNLSGTKLRYIDKSQSTYNTTHMTLASIMLTDYHQLPSSPKYFDRVNFFPFMMYKNHTELPLISYLKKANSFLIWSGNVRGGCRPSKNFTCINSSNDISLRNSFEFYLTTPLHKIYRRIFNKSTEPLQDSINKFLKHINNNGLPKTKFFAFIHHLSPHSPYLVTNECQPTNYFDRHLEGYKASYQCALKTIKKFMVKINDIDPDAIVIFQADHGINMETILKKMELNDKEEIFLRGKIFNAIKAPNDCFKKYGLPKNNVNTIRFTLNCAYGFELPYRENTHYQSYNESDVNYGTVIQKILYE
jgi:hypothetical protein